MLDLRTSLASDASSLLDHDGASGSQERAPILLLRSGSRPLPDPVSRISTPEIDFARDGKQVSWARLPHSSNISAYGWIPIPIAVIKNGTGPTVLITAGLLQLIGSAILWKIIHFEV